MKHLELVKSFSARLTAKTCPCGSHSNKDGKFVPFVGYIDSGFCHSCGRTFLPNYETSIKNLEEPPSLEPYYIPLEKIAATLKNYESNNFMLWLEKEIGKEGASEAAKTYFIGTAKQWKGATIFWTVDKENVPRRGSVMLYDESGHRVKNKNHSIHAILKISDRKPPECFYGEHLLRTNTRKVAIVESAKTAIIANHFMPEFCWLACNGASGLSREKFNALEGLSVTLFPDAGKYESWQQTAIALKDIAQILVSDILEEECTLDEHKSGIDLADLLLKQHQTTD